MEPTLHPVRFKFLLGEWHLASWRPQMQPVRSEGEAASGWPLPRDVPAELLSPAAAGYWCRQAAVDRFPLGLSRLGPWDCYVPRRECLHCVDIEGDFEGYLSRWSAKARYNLRRGVKKLRELNPERLLEIADCPEQMDAFLRTAADISRTTYQSRLLQSGLRYDPGAAQRMAALAARGEGRGYLLHDRGRAIAFAWCSGAGDRLTYDVIGYLEDSAALSPGTVLLYLIVEDLFRLGRFKVFDFGVGDSPYKQQFATRTLEFADAYLFRPRWHLRGRAWLHWCLDGLSSTIGRVLERAGLKTHVKRWLRRLRS
jgi:Acetyltransferase (GNAT) domain